MALMAAHGEITPMPDACIFSDTGAEPDSVYRYLDWLETVLPFPVHRVSYGDLTEDSLRPRKRVKDSEHGAAGRSLYAAFNSCFWNYAQWRKNSGNREEVYR